MSATAIVGQVPTILGPLTTIFTPPPACTVAVGQGDGGLLGLGLLGGGSAGNFAFLGQSCKAGQPADAATCWPATTSGAPAPPKALGGWGVYSPGIDCPAGYATACSATAGGTSGWPLQFQLTAGETAVGCCPNGYGCANIGGQTCTMIATSTSIPTVTCDGNKVGALETASASVFSLYAPMIQINFQSSDLPSPSQSPAPTSAPGVLPVPLPIATGPSTLTTRTTKTVSAGAPFPTSSSESQSQTLAQQTSSSTDISSQQPPSSQPPSSTTSSAAQPATAPSSTTSAPASTSSPATADLQASSTTNKPSSGFPRMAAVGIGVGGGVAALLIGASALIFCLRRRRNAREEKELDRLYGLGKLDSMTGSYKSDEFPGFYRGQAPTVVRQVNF